MPMLLEPITPIHTSNLGFCDIEGIERNFCSNFSCCDQVFPDLHSLMDHRDNHGMIYATEGLSIYPPALLPSSASPSPSSPSSPLMPTTPLDAFLQWPSSEDMDVCQQVAPVTSTLPEPAPPIDVWPSSNVGNGLLEDLELGEVPIYEQCFNTAVSSVSSSPSPTSMVFSSSSNQLLSLPVNLPFSSRSSSPVPEPRRARSQEFPSTLKVKRSKSTVSLKEDILQKKPTRKAEGRGHGRKRERRYVCPTPGCLKQYLNPNGLKYHQEKGTCQFELSTVEGSSSSPEPEPERASKPSRHRSNARPTVTSNDAAPPTLPTSDTVPDEQQPSAIPAPEDVTPLVTIPPPPSTTAPYRYPQLEFPSIHGPPSRPSYYYLPPFSNTSSSLSMWNGGYPL